MASARVFGEFSPWDGNTKTLVRHNSTAISRGVSPPSRATLSSRASFLMRCRVARRSSSGWPRLPPMRTRIPGTAPFLSRAVASRRVNTLARVHPSSGIDDRLTRRLNRPGNLMELGAEDAIVVWEGPSRWVERPHHVLVEACPTDKVPASSYDAPLTLCRRSHLDTGEHSPRIKSVGDRDRSRLASIPRSPILSHRVKNPWIEITLGIGTWLHSRPNEYSVPWTCTRSGPKSATTFKQSVRPASGFRTPCQRLATRAAPEVGSPEPRL